MNSNRNPHGRRLDPELEELVAGEVLGELTDSERESLSAIRDLEAYSDLLSDLQSTLGGVQLAMESSVEAMPAALRQRIAQEAPAYIGESSRVILDSERDELEEPGSELERERSDFVERPSPARSGLSAVREALAWLACAAAILFALGVRKPESKPIELTLKEQREVLQRSTETIQVPWAATENPFKTPVSGDVVWNTQQQQGVMRFVGLPKNDPTVEQYQLWIIDPDRDDEPIDGGVFNSIELGEDGEVFVKIDAKLKVVSPAAFAITIEKPGGVVVSTQERLPLIAMVE